MNQLPEPYYTDAMQVGGLVWRGIVPWDKTGASRPCLGRFKAQCEYLVWGTNGPRKLEGTCLPGAFSGSVFKEKKRHMTEKPVWLMHELCKIVDTPDAVILDPFCGSGTTLKAATRLGHQSIGFEISRPIADIAAQRLGEKD